MIDCPFQFTSRADRRPCRTTATQFFLSLRDFLCKIFLTLVHQEAAIPVASLSFFRFDSLVARLWVIGQMGLARLTLRQERDALFWKLCGSGTGEGFTPKPNWAVWSILAVWPDEATARARVQDNPIWQRWRAKATESFTVYLDPVSSRGSWAGVNPFLPAPGPAPAPNGLALAVLTRATIRPARAWRFWARVPGISAVIGNDPNVAFKIGIGEVPLLHQVTFSIWPDAAAMVHFARGDGPHGRAIQAVRDGNWFAEELYARFRVIGTEGRWNGGPPLPARPHEKAPA